MVLNSNTPILRYLLDQPLDSLERGEVLSDGRRDGVPHGADSDRLYVHERLRVLDGIVDNLCVANLYRVLPLLRRLVVLAQLYFLNVAVDLYDDLSRRFSRGVLHERALQPPDEGIGVHRAVSVRQRSLDWHYLHPVEVALLTKISDHGLVFDRIFVIPGPHAHCASDHIPR